MSFLAKLERQYDNYAVSDLSKYIIIGQALVFVLESVNPPLLSQLVLIGDQVIAGEFWRLLTFVFIPSTFSPMWLVFELYLFYLYGSSLETALGTFRYNIYLITAYLSLIGVSFIFPDWIVPSLYLYISVFLAYALLFPDTVFRVFFVIPVQAKWLGVLAWFGIIVALLTAPFPQKILVSASLVNFLIFFWDESVSFVRENLRFSAPKRVKKSGKHYHECAVCGRNEVDDPDMEIRYCTQCFPTSCFCGAHIHKHKHKVVN